MATRNRSRYIVVELLSISYLSDFRLARSFERLTLPVTPPVFHRSGGVARHAHCWSRSTTTTSLVAFVWDSFYLKLVYAAPQHSAHFYGAGMWTQNIPSYSLPMREGSLKPHRCSVARLPQTTIRYPRSVALRTPALRQGCLSRSAWTRPHVAIIA